MNIAIVGYFGWYGSMAEWVADAWEMNGHTVTKIDRKSINIPDDSDLVLFIDCSEDFSANIPDDIKQPKVFWSYDAHMDYGIERSVNIARKCDLVFSMNYEHGVKLLEKFGVESFWMPSTYSERLCTLPDNYKSYEKEEPTFCMIGNPNSPERVKLWEILHNIPHPALLADTPYFWPAFTGRAETEEEYRFAMNSCKIVINQPTEPWDIITGIRFFEALGSRKLCLQKRIKTRELEKLGFEDGKDFIYWDNFEDLKEKLSYWASNGHRLVKDYLDIVNSGHEKVKKMSMTAQAAKMEQIILTKFYDRL